MIINISESNWIRDQAFGCLLETLFPQSETGSQTFSLSLLLPKKDMTGNFSFFITASVKCHQFDNIQDMTTHSTLTMILELLTSFQDLFTTWPLSFTFKL